MNPGRLNDLITIKRINKVADGYGGYDILSTSDTQNIWCDFKEKSGKIEMVDGKNQKKVEAELIVRKDTADSIAVGEYFVLTNTTKTFRINEMYESDYKYYVTIKATRVD